MSAIKAAAAFVMKGRMRAVLVATVLAVMALKLPPLGLLSAAVVGLAVLRQGWKEGLIVLVSCLLAVGGLGGLLFEQPLAMALMGLSIWLPIAGLAIILGRTGSLRAALEASAVFAAVLIGLQYLLLDDPVLAWTGALDDYTRRAFDASMLAEVDRQQLVGTLAGWMPGGVATAWMGGAVVTLLLVRAADFSFAGPGAFGKEFRDLRFSRWLLLLVPVLLVFGIVLSAGTPGVLGHLYLLGMLLFVIQGVSVAHCLVQIHQASTTWLVGLYLVLFLVNPYGATAIAAAGYSDGWLDFRAKARARAGSNPGGD